MSDTPSHQVLEQAAQWFALLLSGEASAADRRRWEAWLQASDAHRQAWAHVDQLSSRLNVSHASDNPRWIAAAYQQASQGRTRTRRRQMVLGMAALACSGSLAWATWQHTAVKPFMLAWTADYGAGVGQLRDVTLADGTRVWLNAKSAFNQDYPANRRVLQLVRGDILIETAHDPQERPFYVQTPQGRIQALGTRFHVRLEADGQTRLTLYEGAVQVEPLKGAAKRVQAGQSVRFSVQGVASHGAAEASQQAWTHGLLVANNISLSEVVDELRRHFRGHMALAPEIADLRVFGSYPVNQPEQALAILATVMPIQIHQPLPWWIGIAPKR